MANCLYLHDSYTTEFDFMNYAFAKLVVAWWYWGRSGSVVECLTQDGGAVGLSLTGITALWSLSKTHFSWLSTGSTQEDLSLYNWKIVDGR